LHNAIYNKGHIDIVKLLLNNGADVNSKGNLVNTPLHWAAFNGNIEIVKLLLEKGADFNLKYICVHTPLHFADSEGHIEIVKLLLLINLIKVDGSRLHISNYKIKSFRLLNRLNKLFNVERFKANIKYFIENNFKCMDDIENDRDKLEIFLMILSFKKFFNCVVNVKNYVEIRDFIKFNDLCKFYKIYVNIIDNNIIDFNSSNEFRYKLFSNFNKSNFSDLDIIFN
jgi:hypothetical protein